MQQLWKIKKNLQRDLEIAAPSSIQDALLLELG